MSQEALINKDVLRWARTRAGLAPEIVAKGITPDPQKFLAWEEGDALPTLVQARKLADRLRVPFGYLFLSTRPEEQLPVPDLRTRDDRPLLEPSPDLVEQLNLTVAKQRWYREYRLSRGLEAVPIVNRFKLDAVVEEVAADIRATLNLAKPQFEAVNWSSFLSEFVRVVEAADILVMRSGVVGNNSHRPLNADEFQGFAIADPIAPLIFINSRDFLVARIFTLAHELAHIWVGQSGVTLIDPADPLEHNVQLERWCNAIAAEVLVPRDDFLRQWRPDAGLNVEVSRLARRYRVSGIVVLRRALDLDQIPQTAFFDQLEIERNRQVTRPQESSGNQINNIIARNSRIFTEAVISAAFEGKVGYADASRFLSVKVKTLRSLAGVFGIQ